MIDADSYGAWANRKKISYDSDTCVPIATTRQSISRHDLFPHRLIVTMNGEWGGLISLTANQSPKLTFNEITQP